MSTGFDFEIPALAAGINLKPRHYKKALTTNHNLDFFEVHAENFMGAGGPPHRWLQGFRAQYPLSFHGVCLSIGGRDGLDRDHLERLAVLIERYKPALVSEHLAWSSDRGFFINDLLPPPLNETSLQRICDHVDLVQARLKREILIENPSHYLRLDGNEIPEPAFLNELARRTGCGLLLDINNVFVSACNIGFDADDYIDAINVESVKEIHLAGHAVDQFEDEIIRVDNHSDHVCIAVLQLFRKFIYRSGPIPTLIEWDTNVPAFETLAAEAAKAKQVMRVAVEKERLHESA